MGLLLAKIGIARNTWNEQNTQILSTLRSTDYICEKHDISYFPEPVQHELTHERFREHNVHFDVDGRNISVLIVSHDSHSSSAIHEMVCKIYTWLLVVSDYADRACSTTLMIRMYMTTQTKCLPNIETIEIDREHVNSAYTYACKTDNIIHVYRKEEWFKVFIHETFHAFGLDFAKQDNSQVEQYMQSVFHTNNNIRCYESYCEFWATIINTVFIAYLNTPYENTVVKWEKNVMKTAGIMLERERMFSTYQCSKILAHYQMSYDQLFRDFVSDMPITTNIYRENTPVLSYHFIKACLMWNMDKLIQWCADANHYSIKFNDDKHNYERVANDFCRYIHKFLRDPVFMQCLQDIPSPMNMVGEIDATMRMTIYG